jgi:hypothetical protein
LHFGHVLGGDQELDGLGDLGRGLDLEIVLIEFNRFVKQFDFLSLDYE